MLLPLLLIIVKECPKTTSVHLQNVRLHRKKGWESHLVHHTPKESFSKLKARGELFDHLTNAVQELKKDGRAFMLCPETCAPMAHSVCEFVPEAEL